MGQCPPVAVKCYCLGGREGCVTGSTLSALMEQPVNGTLAKCPEPFGALQKG